MTSRPPTYRRESNRLETTVAKPLVIGIGNADRGDDGVGPEVARALSRLHGDEIDTLVVEGDLSDLALRWQSHDSVIVVDAMVSGRAPGTIIEIDGLTTALYGSGSLLSSHGLGLAGALGLARLLGRMPRSLVIFAVEGASFGLMAPMTPAVALAGASLVDRISHRQPGMIR